jgi:tripartite-type tricarboxylate transporter receptor subunit TctC
MKSWVGTRSVRSMRSGALAGMIGLAPIAVVGIGPALALDYPTRPVHLIVGYPAGGTT